MPVSDAAPRKLLLGLIGAGIQQSLTPAMQEAEAAAQGLRAHYQLIDLDRAGVGVEALPGLITAARTMGFAGLNITFPCKQAVIPLLDGLSDDARAMGAVNTVVFSGGRAIGHAHAALRLGVGQLTLIDTEAVRAQALADSLNALYGSGRVQASTDVAAVLPTATGLVHATPTGMAKLPGLPLPASLLRPG
ncbi:MAG: shikimate dehydrogenase, partial [Burkholderiales bacterium PBB5]